MYNTLQCTNNHFQGNRVNPNPDICANIYALCKYAILWAVVGQFNLFKSNFWLSIQNRWIQYEFSNMVEAVPKTEFIEFMRKEEAISEFFIIFIELWVIENTRAPQFNQVEFFTHDHIANIQHIFCVCFFFLSPFYAQIVRVHFYMHRIFDVYVQFQMHIVHSITHRVSMDRLNKRLSWIL